MLAPFFHAWERRLASVTKDRVVRPFDWGLDWLAPNGHHQIDAGDRVAAWVNEVMRDTPGFFDLPPSSDFTFTEAPDALRKQGEGGTLRFPSAVVTPHAENNTVVARWFPAPGEPPPSPTHRASAGQVARGRVAIVMSVPDELLL